MAVPVNTVLPPAGTPGVGDFRNPTLIPNFDRNMVSDGADPTMPATVNHSSPASYLAASPRADASATATIGGSVTTGDILTIVATNPVFPNGFISETYTTVGGDTVTTIAENFADLFNNNPVAGGANLTAEPVGAVITFNQSGPVGNFTVLSAPNLEAVKVTVAGTALTGDEISILIASPNLGPSVLITRAVTTGDSVTTSANALVASINANAALIAAGITATNSAGVITFVIPAAEEPVTVSTWVNTAAPTATITGSVAAADVLNLIFTGAGIAGSPVTISHTALLGETTTTLATNLAAAINANAALSNAGIAATSSTNVISVTGFGGNTNGQVRLTQSVSPGSETITITTAPTTTSTLSTAATETITFSNSGAMAGGTGPVFATNNFEFSRGSQVSAFFYGQPYDLPYELLSDMVSQGMPLV